MLDLRYVDLEPPEYGRTLLLIQMRTECSVRAVLTMGLIDKLAFRPVVTPKPRGDVDKLCGEAPAKEDD
eukprot:2988100-Rhodomonas_salina.1